MTKNYFEYDSNMLACKLTEREIEIEAISTYYTLTADDKYREKREMALRNRSNREVPHD